MYEYKEPLQSGGYLIVKPNTWYIQYYFPGPDMRYNGTFKFISNKEIDFYINAWKNNFSKYKKLKSELDPLSSFNTQGELGMNIYIGGIMDGVCIDFYNMNVRTQEDLNKIINDYKKAKERASKIQELLLSI